MTIEQRGSPLSRPRRLDSGAIRSAGWALLAAVFSIPTPFPTTIATFTPDERGFFQLFVVCFGLIGAFEAIAVLRPSSPHKGKSLAAVALVVSCAAMALVLVDWVVPRSVF